MKKLNIDNKQRIAVANSKRVRVKNSNKILDLKIDFPK